MQANEKFLGKGRKSAVVEDIAQKCQSGSFHLLFFALCIVIDLIPFSFLPIFTTVELNDNAMNQENDIPIIAAPEAMPRSGNTPGAPAVVQQSVMPKCV